MDNDDADDAQEAAAREMLELWNAMTPDERAAIQARLDTSMKMVWGARDAWICARDPEHKRRLALFCNAAFRACGGDPADPPIKIPDPGGSGT